MDLISVFALCIKKMLVLLLCAFLGMGLVCGFRVAKISKGNYEAEIVQYNQKLSALNSELDSIEKGISEKRNLKSVIDNIIASVQDAGILASYASLSSSLVEEMKLLEESLKLKKDEVNSFKASAPDSSGFSVKYAVVGFLAGGFVSVTVLLTVMIGANYVTGSFDAEKRLKAPVLGALYVDRGLFDIAARRIMKERNWKNPEDAVKWMKMNLDSSVIPEGSKVCLLYSGNDGKAVSALEQASSIMSDCGYKVSALADAFKNPDANSVIENCDAVVVLERQFKSKWSSVNAVVNTAERYGKKVCGIILC